MRLRDRLVMHGISSRRSHVEGAQGEATSSDHEAQAGWDHVSWVAPVDVPLASALGAGVLPRGFEALAVPSAAKAAQALATLHPDAEARGAHAQRPAIVLDIETSGLGSTIVPFMAAAAWHDGDGVRLEQWTLQDPSAERGFLEAVFTRLKAVMRPQTWLLSYNGGSFDLPRLRTRAARLHLDAEALSAPHLDLVVPTRRLLKDSLVNCRLSTIEAEVLGLRRRGDMGGAEIAELWDRMRRCSVEPGRAVAFGRPVSPASPASMETIQDPFIREDLMAAQVHNRGDVWGLFSVLTQVAATLGSPRTLAEAAGAAQHFQRSARPQRAVEVLQPFVQLFGTGGRIEAQSVHHWVEAALSLAEIHRAMSAFEAAAVLWRRVCQVAPGNIRAHEALAKHLEHRVRCPSEALEVAMASAAPCPRRLTRLRRKVGLASVAQV